MKLNKCITLFSLLLCFSGLSAQAPGYMSKRCVVGYGFNFNPMLKGSNAQNQTLSVEGGSAESGRFRLNMTHEAFMEYAIARKISLGTEFHYFRTGYDNRLSIGALGQPTDFYVINNFGGALYSKFFFRKYVAPWGSYFKLGLVVNASTSSQHEFMYLKSAVKDRDTLLFDFGPQKQTQLNFDIQLGFGRTRIFSNKYIVEYGFNTQVISLFSSLIETLPSEVSREDYIMTTTRNRVNDFMRLNLFIKLGYLF